jgi:hypothetical protein
MVNIGICRKIAIIASWRRPKTRETVPKLKKQNPSLRGLIDVTLGDTRHWTAKNRARNIWNALPKC